MSDSQAASRARIEAELVAIRRDLMGFLKRNASATLLRFETAEDLFQGFASHALSRAERFEDRGEGAASAWLYELARNFLRDRHRHWTALKRGSGRILRSGLGAPASSILHPSGGGSSEPTASQTGPATIAAKREQLVLAAKALALLLPRDRQLVEWSAEGLSIAEMAEELGISADAAGKARNRALERLRKTHELVLRRVSSSDR